MNCKDVNSKLIFYLDNELSESEKQSVELHLANCAVCRQEVEALAGTQHLLRQGFQALDAETVPSWKWVELEQCLAAQNERKTTYFSRIMYGVKSFVSWQPVWKSALSGVLVIAIIISSVLFVPRLWEPTPEETATLIAADDPEVEALIQGQPSIQEARASDTTGYVVNQGPSGESYLAYIDLQSGTISRLLRLTTPPLSEEEKTRIINIARTGIDIQRLLDRGGSIDGVYLISPLYRLELLEEEPHIWFEGIMAEVVLRAEGQTWLARVDIRESRALYISQPTPQPEPFVHINASYSMEELVNIAKSDIKAAELFEQSAQVISVVTGDRGMADKGVLVLKLGDEVAVVRIDLPTETVTAVEKVPTASWEKGYFLKTEP
jgi:hypothetical protein